LFIILKFQYLPFRKTAQIVPPVKIAKDAKWRILSEVRVILVLCIVFCRSLFVPFVLFLMAIVLYVLLRFTASDYPFGILDSRLLITPLVSWNFSKEMQSSWQIITILLFRIMSIPTIFRLFRVLTSEMLGRRLPVFTLLLWQRPHIIVADAVDYK